MADQPTPDERLSALLHDAVSDVEPRPALDAIQARTKVTTMSSKRPWIYAAVGAVAATAATITAVTVLADDDPATTGGPAGSPTPTASASPEPSEPSPTDAPTDEPTQLVPVYFVADQPVGLRLFREFHPGPESATPAGMVQGALEHAVAGSALDPDYRSDWPEDTVVSGVNVDGTSAEDLVWIDLTGNLHDRPAGMSEQAAGMAIEQLMFTAHGVLQGRNPIQFTLNGERTDTLLGVPVSEPLAAADPMEVQGSVWVIDPQDGDTVDSTFRVEGRGAFFEANVSWQLLQGDAAVEEGFATAEEGMTLSPYAFTIKNVPAGDYVLRVYDADMSGGEGPGEAEDTKNLTVTD